jgi:hypothetical protein
VQHVVGEPGGLGAEVAAREASLLGLGKAALDGRVLDLAQVLDLVIAQGADPSELSSDPMWPIDLRALRT